MLSLVTCKQRADHFTPIVWFDFIRGRFHFIRRLFHYSNYIKYNQNDVIQNSIWPETHNWCMYTIWEIETQNLWFRQILSQGEMGGPKIFACLSTYGLFVEQPVVSLLLYNGAVQWLMEAGWEWPAVFSRSHLKIQVRNRWSPIHILHRFASKLHILHKSDKYCPLGSCLMPQSHHTPGPRTGCSRAVLNKNRTSTPGAWCGAVRILPRRTGP